ncbi:MAG: LCP family protein [Chloroflexota bacterium]|nr:LCP family protein [Chloroflexota bacterium]
MSKRRSTKTTKQDRQRPKIYEVFTVMVFFVLICLLGFIFTKGLASGNNLSAAQAYALQTQKVLNATPTLTPFQPVGDPVNAYTNPETTPFSTPDPDNITEITPTSTLKRLTKPKGQVNILLLGSDVRPNEGGFRTDIIVWVSLNPKDGFVSAISFPRDLFVNIPGMGENRINVVFPYGGFDLLADTFEINFGVRPDKYILVDFTGFKAVINNLGGIDVQTKQNLTDSCDKSINASGVCSAGPGLVHMNGDLALWYARSRYSTNDIDRARRAQEVIEAIFNRLMRLDVILRVSDLYSAYTTYVQTDIGLSNVIPLLPLASKINENKDIRNYVVGYDLAYDWITWQGAQVLIPDIDGIRELMIEALTLQ